MQMKDYQLEEEDEKSPYSLDEKVPDTMEDFEEESEEEQEYPEEQGEDFEEETAPDDPENSEEEKTSEEDDDDDDDDDDDEEDYEIPKEIPTDSSEKIPSQKDENPQGFKVMSFEDFISKNNI